MYRRLDSFPNVSPLLLAAMLVSLNAGFGSAAEKVTYDDHVLPIFRAKCLACHNTDKKVGGLDLSSYIAAIEGGSSGAVIEPGDAGSSYLFNVVNHDTEPYMPPMQDKLPAATLAVISNWIDGGALENAGSVAKMSKKPKFDFGLKGAPSGKPEGPAAMPGPLVMEPVVHTDSTTAVTALATSPWAPLVAVAGQKQVLLYHSETLKMLGVLPFPEGVAHVLKFSRSGDLLLAGGGHGAASGKVVVWNVRNGERVFEIGDELDTVLAADISADQSLIALGGPAKVVRVYSTRNGKLVYEVRKHTDWIYELAFSPDGVLLATADRNGGMFVWEAYTGREYLALAGHGAAVTGMSWRADSNLLASCSEDVSIHLWEMENGGRVKNWNGHNGGTLDVEFARDGRLVSTGRDRITKLWDQSGKQLQPFAAFGDIALQSTICDETNRVIAGDWNGTVRVWNAADGTAIGELSPNPPKLEERLTAASALLTTVTAEFEKLKVDNQTAQTALETVKAGLETANQQAAELQKQIDAATAMAGQAKQTSDTLSADLAALTKTIQVVEPAVQLLTDASKKAQEAVAQLPEDKELAAATAQLQTQFQKRSTELETVKKTATEKTAALETSKQQMAAAQKQVADATAALQTVQKQVTDLTAALKSAQEKATATQTAVDDAGKRLNSAQTDVAFWKNHIGLRDGLAAMSARRSEFDELDSQAAEAEEAVAMKTAELKSAEEAVAAAQQNATSAQTAVDQTRQVVEKYATQAAEVAKQVTTLQTVLPLVQQTLAKGQEAAAKAPADTDLAGAADQLKALLEKKTGELDVATKLGTTTATELEKSQQQLKEAEVTAVAMAKLLADAQQKVADLKAALQPIVAKANDARKAAESAGQLADAALEQVDQWKARIDPNFNLAQAQAEVSK